MSPAAADAADCAQVPPIWGEEVKYMSEMEIVERPVSRKVLDTARLAIKTAEARKAFQQALVQLNKTIPKETRKTIASYVALLRQLSHGGEVDPKTLGTLVLEVKKALRSWRIEHAQEREIVSKTAKEFYRYLNLLTKKAEEVKAELGE